MHSGLISKFVGRGSLLGLYVSITCAGGPNIVTFDMEVHLVPSTVQESLIALANSITLSPPTKLTTGNFEITLTGDPLQVSDVTPIRSVTSGAVDLAFALKNVRFTKTDITDLSTVGGMPIQLFATQLLDGSTAAAGIPGLLGSLKGTVPVVVDSVGSALAVQIQVRVTVRDDKNQLDPYVNWSFSTGATGVGGEGTSTPSTTLPIVTTLQWRLPVAGSSFVGAFTELTTQFSTDPSEPLPIQVVNRTITVEVNLSAAGVSTDWIALPSSPISIPAIPVPTLVALFDDVGFNTAPGQNGTLILLPDDSPLTPTGETTDPLQSLLSTALQTLRDLVNGLVANATGTGGFNPFNPLAPLASIIEDLVNDLTNGDRATQIHFVKASTVANLNDSQFLIHGSDPANDRVSSMLVLGPMGLTVHCYNNWNFDSSVGAFDVRVGVEMAVGVASLPSNPLSFPLGNLTVTVPSTAGQHAPSSSFNDSLSSVQMVKA